MKNNFIMVIFGATGDLSMNKLMPSLFSLFKQGYFQKKFHIVGYSRRDINEKEFKNLFEDLAQDTQWDMFSKNISYQKGDFSSEQGYKELVERFRALDKKMGKDTVKFFYLATPPIHYETILDNLVSNNLTQVAKDGREVLPRIIIEKPFGKDLQTARRLDKKLSKIFKEEQIFRVDHYMGKETVQNMIAFRFANSIFEPVWNKDFVDHIQINWGEVKGVERRGEFFDGVGLLRDVAQNHIMQLVAAVAMEQPKSFTDASIRDARVDVVKSLRIFDFKNIHNFSVRGQYEGYLKEKNITHGSRTETFIAMKWFVDSPRFENTPFYIRVGKKAPKDVVEISIVFKQTCHILFKDYGCPEVGNVLTIRIQPDEGISFRVIAKEPGPKLGLNTIDIKFSYKDQYKGRISDAYEKILIDIFNDDQTLFNRSDELDYSWAFITQILQGWEKQKMMPLMYKPGTWGPKEADKLIEKDGRKWLVQ